MRVDLKALKAMIHALKGTEFFIHTVCPPLTVLSYLSCEVLYMHNITEALLINVDISMETYL